MKYLRESTPCLQWFQSVTAVYGLQIEAGVGEQVVTAIQGHSWNLP